MYEAGRTIDEVGVHHVVCQEKWRLSMLNYLIQKSLG